jgi:hypothetical protein
VIVLDENFSFRQRSRLQGWRIRFRQIGADLLRKGADDSEIIPLLHRLTSPTFFTWDRHFYDRDLRHRAYCLVYLDVAPTELAHFTRRFLRHPAFRTNTQRRGTVVHVGYAGTRVWRLNSQAEEASPWPETGRRR